MKVYCILWLNYNHLVKMSSCGSHQIMINNDGFATCKICQVIILYECPDCFSILRHKGANHHCPENSDDEGLGIDIIDDNIWNSIKDRKCELLIYSNIFHYVSIKF